MIGEVIAAQPAGGPQRCNSITELSVTTLSDGQPDRAPIISKREHDSRSTAKVRRGVRTIGESARRDDPDINAPRFTYRVEEQFAGTAGDCVACNGEPSSTRVVAALTLLRGPLTEF